MPSLKDLRNRIGSVKSTQKITKAMKMVAASKLRKAQERAEAARPYSEKMEQMLLELARKANLDNASPYLVGRRNEAGDIVSQKHLIIVATSDKGLCGGFNSSIARAAKRKVDELERAGKSVKLLLVGKKGYDQLKLTHSDFIIDRLPASKNKEVEFTDAEEVGARIIAMFEAGEVDSCSIFYNKFVSVITQKVTYQQLIPLDLSALGTEASTSTASQSIYEYEPSEDAILTELLPRNISVQIFHAMLENAASVQGARMSAMDSASRNAGEMIKGLTLQYNRSRQAAITKELIEIISGAEAI